MRADKLRGTDVFLDEASVMATENVVMAAVLAEGETVIGNAACEPHVQDLAHFLCTLGANIEGIGTNTVTIHGANDAVLQTVSLPNVTNGANQDRLLIANGAAGWRGTPTFPTTAPSSGRSTSGSRGLPSPG